MSRHTLVHTPVGGRILTRPFLILLMIAALAGLVAIYRFAAGLGSVSALNDGYPWGIWIGIDVVVGTALGCGGFAIGLLVYILNKGEYHPLVRPAVLTSLLGYGLAVVAVTIDLGRYWGLWKVPTHFWRWTHSPQLEVALCVAAYVAVLLIEISPAVFEKWREGKNAFLRSFSERGLRFMDGALVWILALGMLLPTMHQSSLGTMMLLPGSKVHPLWFTPWVPFLFLVNAVLMGFAVVTLEATFSAIAFKRPRETAMLASLARVIAWIGLFWAAFRIIEPAIAGELRLVASARGLAYAVEVGLTLAGALVLLSPGLRARSSWQVRGAMLLLLGGVAYRLNTYLVAFSPGANWHYFPSLLELTLTFGIIATEIAIYIAVIKIFPILSGAPRLAPSRS